MPYKDRNKRVEYIKSSGFVLAIRFMYESDADLVEWLKRQKKPSTEIKRILKDYLESHPGEFAKEKEGAE